MNHQTILLLTVAIPFLGAFLLPLLGIWSARLRSAFSFTFVFLAFLCSSMLIPQALSKGTLTFSIVFPFSFNLTLTADSLAVFMACISSLVGAIIVLYSFGYISHYEHQNEYYFLVVLFLGAMMGLVFSANLILLYLFWEVTAFACWRLIGFFRGKEHVVKADKAFLITVTGALMMLLGFIMIYQQAGSFELSVIKEYFRNHAFPEGAVILILGGILSKSATLPLHTWLPDAGCAPSPVTALLHAAVLVKIGVYVFARLFIATVPLAESWQMIVMVIAGTSAIISALAAFTENDLKRIIAYSTVSQIAFIFLGLAAGNKIGIFGGLLYICMHGIAKAGLFLCAGIVEQNTKTKDISKLGGLFKSMPITTVSFFLCSCSVMGVPPFGGFFSKYFVIMGPLRDGHLMIGLTFLIGACLTILYLMRVFTLVFLGEAPSDFKKEGSKVMVASVALLALFSLISGILVQYPSLLAESAVGQMMAGVVK